MVRKEAIAIHRANIDPLILYGYKSADESFTVNDNDPDLKSITISLPEPPDWSLIDGWGLEAKNQKFRKAVYPARLKELEDKIIRSVEDSRATAKNEVVTVQRIIDEIWKQLELKQNEYRDEIEWIEKQWYFILYGYWVFINGKPTFIDGWYYRFLNFWDLTDATTEYRDRDRRFFHFQRYAFESTEDAFGKDVGHRTIYGTTYPKHRRDGATHKFLSIVYGITSITQGSLIGGIQSFDDDNASEQYRNKLLPAFKAMPFFLKPIWKGTQAPQAELSFTRVDNKIGDELGSRINFATTAFRKFYDGKKLISIILDEEGKCLGFRTLVKMADGTNKEVQDIVVGDKLCGDDMETRNVLSVTSGQDEMFKIIPNKGESWTCNGAHILTLKYVGASLSWVKSKSTIDISVNEYLRRGLNGNKNFSLFRTGIEFKESAHKIDPYFLGIWLGDGTSNSASISKPDKEIVDYVRDYAERNGMNCEFDGLTSRIAFNRNVPVVATSKDGTVSTYDTIKEAVEKSGVTVSKLRRNTSDDISFEFGEKGENVITKYMRELDLFNNKHIPKEYLVDSRENRLELLAGILDTDGYMSPGARKMVYEITQKSKQLSDDIITLCESLGFSITRNEKIARLKRDGKEVYEYLVYRMNICGSNLYEIPCKIPRKKAYKIENNKGRDPMRSGFKIEPLGRGDYYGFTIDGNGRFLLGDYTVTHNTKSENIFERWDVIKQTLSQGSGSSIHGFAAHPTTVADMDEGGGKNYYDLNEGSKFYERNIKSGQTKTGLIRLFIPATDGLENFVGPYGESIIETPTQEQAEFIGRDYGAKEYLQSQLDEFVRIGTPDAMQSYRNLKGLFPTQYADCFRTAKGDTGFDIDKLDKAIEKLRRESLDEINPPTVRGDFKYIIPTEPNPYTAKEYLELELFKKHPSPRVEWFPSKDGRWDVSEILEASRSNLKVQEHGEFFPQHPFRYTAGADPFQFLDKGNSQKREDKARWSKGGGSVFRERDFDIDPTYKEIKDWTTNCFVATYENRPETDDEYAEEMLMACIYYGAEMYCEQNIRLVWKHFIKRKHGGYLKYQVDETTNRPKEYPGFFSLQNSKQQLFNAVKTYIKWHIHREKHLKFIEQCRAIKGVEYMTDYDLFTGCGAALLGSQIVRFEVDASESDTGTEIGDIMPTFTYR